MRLHTITAGAILALALTACSAAPPAEPAQPPSASASPTLDKAKAIQLCIDAVAAQPADEESKPAECEPLSESEYLDANLKGVQQHNQAGRDDLQRQIEEAQESGSGS